jgi:hypothetical protein
VKANEVQKRASFHAEQGTAAHELLEICQRLDVQPEKFLGTLIYKDFEVTEEMAEAVGRALDWIKSYMARYPKAKLYIETRVDPAKMLGCEKELTSGTLDTALADGRRQLVIMDYKHGSGVLVEVGEDEEINTQLLMYTLGFIAEKGIGYDSFDDYLLVICQPRHRHEQGPVREVHVTKEQLKAFVAHVKKRLASIRTNPDERVAGDWCKWCAAAGKCRALAERKLAMAKQEFCEVGEPVNPQELTDEERAWILKNVPIWNAWLKAVYADAHEFVMKGGKIPGTKLVEGRSERYVSNEDKAKELLAADNFEEDEYAPRKLVGVPGIEKLYAHRRAEAGTRRKKGEPPIPLEFNTIIQRTHPS